MGLGVLVVTNIIYIILAQGTQLWWDDVKKHGYPKNWNHGPLPTNDVDEETSQDTKEKNEKGEKLEKH